MAISTEIVGQTFGPFERDYTFRDLEICALGCGAAWDGITDLAYVNEGDALDPCLKVLPIFGVPFTVNEEVTKTLDYGYDYSGSLHYGIDVRFHEPFQMADSVRTFVTQEALWDRGEGRGCLSKQVGKSYGADGRHLCTVETYDCCIYDGGWGGQAPPREEVSIPESLPAVERVEGVPLYQPLVYRLMGDWHQQHIDWAYTEQTGLARPIAHGVSMAGFAMRHVIDAFIPGEPERLRRFKCRFTSPVLPGAQVKTQMWLTGKNSICFRMVDAADSDAKPYLNFGLAEWD